MKLATKKREPASEAAPPPVAESLKVRAGWVKYQLSLHGTSLSQLAVENGADKSAMSHALRFRYPKYQAIIAETIGMKPSDIWPEWYPPSGAFPTEGHDTSESGPGNSYDEGED